MYVRKFVSRKHGPREHYLWVCTEKGWCSVGAEVVLLSVGLLIIINIVIVTFTAALCCHFKMVAGLQLDGYLVYSVIVHSNANGVGCC